MPDLKDTLMALEDAGWEALSKPGGAHYYADLMTANAMMVFPFAVLNRNQVLDVLNQGPPWASHKISKARVLSLTADSAVVIYDVTARRKDGPVLDARLCSTYVRINGDWKLALHQQTPTAS